jgi:hypothetical protein
VRTALLCDKIFSAEDVVENRPHVVARRSIDQAGGGATRARLDGCLVEFCATSSAYNQRIELKPQSRLSETADRQFGWFKSHDQANLSLKYSACAYYCRGSPKTHLFLPGSLSEILL